jgi:predicted transcriptional regulator
MGRGLSTVQKEILALLSEQECITVRALFEHICRSRPALSRSISRLQDRGLVERVSLEVGRRKAPAVRLAYKNLTVREKCDDFSGSECEATAGNKEVSQIGDAN